MELEFFATELLAIPGAQEISKWSIDEKSHIIFDNIHLGTITSNIIFF